MKYDLVIFDCDGTLVDSEPLTMRLLAQMMLEIGVKEDYEWLLENFAGKNMKAITDLIEDHIGPCLLYTSPSPRDQRGSRMPPSA